MPFEMAYSSVGARRAPLGCVALLWELRGGGTASARSRVSCFPALTPVPGAGFFANGFVFLSGFGAVVYCFFYTLQVRWLLLAPAAPGQRRRAPQRRAAPPHCALRPHAAAAGAQGVYADIPTVSEAVYAQVR